MEKIIKNIFSCNFSSDNIVVYKKETNDSAIYSYKSKGVIYNKSVSFFYEINAGSFKSIKSIYSSQIQEESNLFKLFGIE